ncbi:MAG: MATE family efflux transporter [Clostridium sp.]|nr:MATE family efflux transporter [Prevotella sp.]MCM1429073.1 MATE family efflux transporter [Clostridium sp.]MCM1475396.1 MATE family efflux transporter [Muribaculaceae bacterium]
MKHHSDNTGSRIQELATAPEGKLLLKYSLPAVVGTVVMAVYHIIDSMVIGHAVPDPNVVAGIAVSFPVMNIATAFGMLIGAGAATRVSIVMGQKDHRQAAMVLGNCVQLTILIGILYATTFALFIDPILKIFGASPATLPYAREFLLWLLPGMVLINLTFSYNNVMRASGYPSKAMYTSLIGAGLNVILAPLFLFGFGWGVRGAAIATDISMFITAIFVMAHFFNKKNTLHFERGTFRLRLNVIGPVLYIGMAPFLINVTSAGINAIINNSLLKYGGGGAGGDNAIASIVVFNRFVTIFIFIVIGICQGMQPILGYNYGARKYSRLFKTLRLAIICGASFTTLGSLIGAFAPYTIAGMFMTDAQQIECAVNCLHITTITFWVVGFQIVATNFFQSLGMAGKSVFLSLTRQIIFMIPFLFLLPPHFGLDGVWAAFPCSDALSAMVAAGMLLRQLKKIKAKELELEPSAI